MIISTEIVTEESFSFTPEGEEEVVHIRSGRLRAWLIKNAMDRVTNLHFPSDQTEADLIEQHGLEAPRMASMTEAEAKEPVVVGLWQDGSAVLIDGGHRRWFWHKRGINTLRGWAVPYDVWKHFTFDPNSPSVIRYLEDGALLPQRRKAK